MSRESLPSPLDVLDADELFMLALRASAADDGPAALSCLKLAVARQPSHARAHWMLGAEYAALRMPERAGEHYARAVALDPAQPVARFQYGLLRLTCGDVDAAEAVWRGLADRPTDDPLRRFADGLLLLARGRSEEALPALHAAAADPTIPTRLRRDVETVIARIGGAHPADAPAGVTATGPTSADDAATEAAALAVQSHLALSAYGGDRGRS